MLRFDIFCKIFKFKQFHTLIIAEHNNKNISDTTNNIITAAKEIGEVAVLIAGNECQSCAETASKVEGVSKVLVSKSNSYLGFLAEPLTQLVIRLHNELNFTHIMAGANSFGKNLIPRIASKLDVSPISNVTEIISDDTFVKEIYGGNALLTIKSLDDIKLLTICPASFNASALSEISCDLVDIPQPDMILNLSEFIQQEIDYHDQPQLESAKIVISGGCALNSSENFLLIFELAKKINAAVGATRAAVDAGYIPNNYQIGQTGKIIAPDLYIAIGISGATQHLAGMKNSKIIVAINSDSEAPIFKIADYGLIGDLFKILPELINKL